MKIAYHIGVHCTDESRLLRGLLKNRGTLLEKGIFVPTPVHFKVLLPSILAILKGQSAGPATQEALISMLTDDASGAERMVLSHEHLLGFPQRAISDFGLYAHMARRIGALDRVFPDAETEVHLALRNPATLVPAILGRMNTSYEAYISDTDPLTLRWLPTIRRVLETIPDARMTIWCNEDTPLIWPEVLRSLAGTEAEDAMEGEFDLLAAIMSKEGLERLMAYVASHPPVDAAQRRMVTSAFLEKSAIPAEIDVEIDLPGWDAALIEDMTALYEEDVAEIASWPQVDFIQP